MNSRQLFERGAHYSAAEISRLVGGQVQYYLSTVDGTVVAAKLRRRLNPGAPGVVLVGDGPRIREFATIAGRQTDRSFPVFVAEGATPGFTYAGNYVGAGTTSEPNTLAHFARTSGRPDLRLVLYLRAVATVP